MVERPTRKLIDNDIFTGYQNKWNNICTRWWIKQNKYMQNEDNDE